ncbi:MAG: hypothetical protein HYT07_03325 [Candidatus Levybacteria bacterium]|nr:hypothetical protein [Candidatus Levybacteria bacterium]
MVERKYQNELAYRASDSLPFVDRRMVDDVCKLINRKISQEGYANEVYPNTLSIKEQDMVRIRLGLALGKRTTFEPVRLEEGMGTVILVAKKQRR